MHEQYLRDEAIDINYSKQLNKVRRHDHDVFMWTLYVSLS